MKFQRAARRTARRIAGRPEGFGLLASLFVLILIGAIGIAGIALTEKDMMAGRAVRQSAKAFYAAEAGLNAVLSGWESAGYGTLLAVPGDSTTVGPMTIENGFSYEGIVRRVDGGSATQIYVIRVTASGPGSARRMLRRVVFVPPPGGVITSALVSATGLSLDEENEISGYDHCAGSSNDVAGVTLPPGTFSEDDDDNTVEGDPDFVYDDSTAIVAATGIDWAGLMGGTPAPDVTIPPGSLPSSYPPGEWKHIFIDKASHTLPEGMNGRGLLVVRGNLRMDEETSWDGVILVGGRLTMDDEDIRITGALVTGLNKLLGQSVTGKTKFDEESRLRYSSCYVDSAFATLTTIRRVSNGWLESR